MVCTLYLKNDNLVVSVILFYMNYVVFIEMYLIDVVVMFIGFGLERKLT